MRELLVCEGIGRSVMISGMILVAPFGAIWIAVSCAAGQHFIWVLTSVVALPKAGVPRWRAFEASVRPLALALIVFGTILAIKRSFVLSDLPDYLQLVLMIAFSLIVLGLSASLSALVRKDVRLIWETMKLIVGRGYDNPSPTESR